MKTARNDKIHEFCRLPNYHVPGVTGRSNHPRRQKQCAIAMKTARNEKFTSFIDFQINVYRGSRAVEIVPGAKTMRYSP